MPVSHNVMNLILLAPLAAVVVYYDVWFRRIPNFVVLAALAAGLTANTVYGGFDGLLASLGGLLLAFVPMFVLHVFGTMGAGDVKLFAAIGSIIGLKLVLPTFIVIALLGGMLALYSMLRSGTVFSTMVGVLRIFVGLLPGWEMPRFVMPADRRMTIPYGVAITVGSLISAFAFRA